MENEEELFEIDEFQGYYANKSGIIYSTHRKGFKIMSGREDKDGYIEICFRTKNGKKYRRAHRIIAAMFVDGRTETKKIVNHIDKNVKNNNYKNLEWVTNRDNINHGNLTINMSSNFTGVYFCNRNSKWASNVDINGKKFWVGYFNTEKEAASSYNYVLFKMGISGKYITDCEPICYNPSIPERLSKKLDKNGI